MKFTVIFDTVFVSVVLHHIIFDICPIYRRINRIGIDFIYGRRLKSFIFTLSTFTISILVNLFNYSLSKESHYKTVKKSEFQLQEYSLNKKEQEKSPDEKLTISIGA